MNIGQIYKQIDMLSDEEAVGHSYFKLTGQYLNFVFLRYLQAQNLSLPYDFSVLKTNPALCYLQTQEQILDRYHHILPERIYIPDNVNVELQNLPRYLDIPPHRHDFFELVCTLRGRCLHEIEGKSSWMHQGDITIIPPNVMHHLLAEPKSITITVKIRKSTFDNDFSSLLRGGTTLSAYFEQTLYSQHYRNSLTFHSGRDVFLMKLLLYMYAQQQESKKHSKYVIDGMMSTFFPYLVQNFEDTIEFSDGDSAQNQRMVSIESYIRHNYQTVTLTQLSEHFFLSPAYISTLIRRQTGVTFSYILRKIRLEHAAELLTATNMNIEKICERVGYHDPTQFIRYFKKHYEVTPKQFRQKSRFPDG